LAIGRREKPSPLTILNENTEDKGGQWGASANEVDISDADEEVVWKDNDTVHFTCNIQSDLKNGRREFRGGLTGQIKLKSRSAPGEFSGTLKNFRLKRIAGLRGKFFFHSAIAVQDPMDPDKIGFLLEFRYLNNSASAPILTLELRNGDTAAQRIRLNRSVFQQRDSEFASCMIFGVTRDP
jgi:hypothetical protein